MKQTQQRLIAAAVLLALLVGAFFLARSLGEQEAPAGDPTPTAETFDPFFPEQAASLAEVTAFSITENDTGRTLALEQASGFETDTGAQGGGAGLTLDWGVVEVPEGTDPGLGLDTEQIQQATFPLPTLTPTRQLNDIEGSLGDFGLQPPTYEVQFETDFEEMFRLNVGAQTPTQNGYYVQLPGDDTVYIVNVTSIQPLVDLLENPPFQQPPTEEPES
jgi:hypothetical protein